MKIEIGDTVKVTKPKHFSKKIEKGQLLMVTQNHSERRLSLKDKTTNLTESFIPEKAVKLVEKNPPKYIKVTNRHRYLIGRVYLVDHITKDSNGIMYFLVHDYNLNETVEICQHEMQLSTRTEYEDQQIRINYNTFILNKKGISAGSFVKIEIPTDIEMIKPIDSFYYNTHELVGNIGVVQEINCVNNYVYILINRINYHFPVFSLKKLDTPKYIKMTEPCEDFQKGEVLKIIDIDNAIITINRKYDGEDYFIDFKDECMAFATEVEYNNQVYNQEDYFETHQFELDVVYVELDGNENIEKMFRNKSSINMYFDLIDIKKNTIIISQQGLIIPPIMKKCREATIKETNWFNENIKSHSHSKEKNKLYYIPFYYTTIDVEIIKKGKYYSIENKETGQYSIFIVSTNVENKVHEILKVNYIAEIDKERMIKDIGIGITSYDIIKPATQEEINKFNEFYKNLKSTEHEFLNVKNNDESINEILKDIVNHKK